MLCFEWGELLPAAGQEKVSCQSTKALQTKGRAISEIILQLQKAQEFLQINTTKAESSRQESSSAEHQRIALRIYPKRKAAVSQQKLYCTSCRDWESKSQMKILKCSSKWMEMRQKDLSKERWCKIHSHGMTYRSHAEPEWMQQQDFFHLSAIHLKMYFFDNFNITVISLHQK